MKHLITFLFASIFASCLGAQDKTWQVDLKYIEWSSSSESDGKVFKERFERLYEAIRDHDWNAVYAMRTTRFRSTVGSELFLKKAQSLDYDFTGYEVLRQNSYETPGSPQKKRFIIRFHVSGKERYNVVWWIREGGVWNVENLGVEIQNFPLEISFDGVAH